MKPITHCHDYQFSSGNKFHLSYPDNQGSIASFRGLVITRGTNFELHNGKGNESHLFNAIKIKEDVLNGQLQEVVCNKELEIWFFTEHQYDIYSDSNQTLFGGEVAVMNGVIITDIKVIYDPKCYEVKVETIKGIFKCISYRDKTPSEKDPCCILKRDLYNSKIYGKATEIEICEDKYPCK